MPCAYYKCVDNFQATKGIKCTLCSQGFHRKCVNQRKEVTAFECDTCKNAKKKEGDSCAIKVAEGPQDNSVRDSLAYESKIQELEREVESLKEIIKMKDQDIEDLKKQHEEQCKQARVPDKLTNVETPWSQVLARKPQQQKDTEGRKQTTSPIPLGNRFQALENYRQDDHDKNPRNQQEKSRRQENRSRKPKVLLLADSNGRYCGDLIREKLGSNVEVCSFFKPSAKISNVIENIEQLTKDFNENDTVIVHAGSNDLQSEDQELVSNIKRAVSVVRNISKRTNVVLNTVPARYDDEVLNKRGKWVNNIIDEVISQDLNSKLVVNHEPERMSRECFAYDGLHYSRRGKSVLCNRLCALIQCQLKKDCVVSNVSNTGFFSREEYPRRTQ